MSLSTAFYVFPPQRVVMINPLKTIGDILTTLLTVLFLGCFAVFCFRLGWLARDNPVLSSFGTLVTNTDQKSDDKDCHDILSHRFGHCD